MKINLIEDNPFITAEHFPPKLYKYRDWDNKNHRKILNGELYFSSPLNFNDPFDCNISIAFEKLQNNIELQYRYFEKIANNSTEYRSDLDKQKEIERYIKEGRFNNPNWLDWQSK